MAPRLVKRSAGLLCSSCFLHCKSPWCTAAGEGGVLRWELPGVTPDRFLEEPVAAQASISGPSVNAEVEIGISAGGQSFLQQQRLEKVGVKVPEHCC